MTTLKCLIIDDEIMARKTLERHCHKVDYLEVASVHESAESAILFLKKQKVDLIFLDIEMPGLNGIDFLKEAVNLPQIIFTSAKTEYAFEAFQHQVTDYLQKPIDFQRFSKAVEKASEIHEQNNLYKSNSNDIYIRNGSKYIRLPYSKIQYFENAGDYVKVKMEGDSHVINATLKSILERLDHSRFLKVHRSYIINLNKIKDIDENSLVIGKKVIPISRSNRPILMGRLNIL